MEILDNQSAGKLIPPRKSTLIDLLCKTNPEHPIAQKYQEQEKKYLENLQEHIAKIPKKEEPVLPELKPIDVEDFYNVFKSAFNFFNGKEFDEHANQGEGKMLAKTLCLYFLNRKSFLKSPLLNKKSAPSLEKGIMIIGDYGTGKTSIMKTFHDMISYSKNNPIGVKDIEGTNQFLGRYSIGFGYHTANDVVKTFESINNPEEKQIFWRKMTSGTKYFDDVMTEATASNYGKIEVFKDIFEMRYMNSAKTLISLNYSGNSVDSTLDEVTNKYGPRVYDRIFEMFNIIELKGESLRK